MPLWARVCCGDSPTETAGDSGFAVAQPRFKPEGQEKKKQDCDGNITRWVTHISPSTPWKEQAKRKEGFDLVVLTRGNTDAQRGQVISSTTDGHPPGCSIQVL